MRICEEDSFSSVDWLPGGRMRVSYSLRQEDPLSKCDIIGAFKENDHYA